MSIATWCFAHYAAFNSTACALHWDRALKLTVLPICHAACRVCPFSGANEGQIVGVVLNGLRPTIPVMEIGASSEGTTGHVPVPVAHLIERCWAQDPMFRPGFDQVVVALEAAAAALNLDINNESE